MTLHVHALNPHNKADHAYIAAIARIHLAAWLTVPLMRTIYYGDDPETRAAYIAANTARHSKAFVEEFEASSGEGEGDGSGSELCRFAVVLDDALPADEEILKAISTSGDDQTKPTGKVIAAVKYYLVTPPSASSAPDTASSSASTSEPSSSSTSARDWPPHSHERLASDFWSHLVRARTRLSAVLGPHVLVDNLYTDPAHHRRGAGGMLMRHAVAQADARGLPSLLEASPGGIGVYESVGFRRVDDDEAEIWVDLRRWEHGGDKGLQFSQRREKENGRRTDDGWYCQVVMVRPAPENVDVDVAKVDGLGKGEAAVV